MQLELETINTEVLVIGGGLAGSMAAIRASEIAGQNNVVVIEKGNVQRSGNAATGVDHTWSYIPDFHKPLGFTIEQLVEDHLNRLGPLQDVDVIYTIASTIAERIKEMERWGFPFKTNGKYDFVQKIHRVPTFLHWAGRDQKVLFSRELSRRGIKVINRVMVTELIKQDGRIVGAIGVGIREPKLFLFRAKAVVLTVGGISRVFRGPTSMDFNRQRYPYAPGDGVALGYRAGAELTGLEFIYTHSGPKNFCKPGRGTWIGVVEDASGEPLREVKVVSDPKKIDLSVESPADMMNAYKQGRAPVFINCTGDSEEDLAYMEWGLSNEGNTVLLQHMKEAGINPGKDKVEFTFYEPEVRGGLVVNAKGETNLSGLFTAGDTMGNIKRGVSPAAFAIGWIAGENAAQYATGHELDDAKETSHFAEDKKLFYQQILDREDGATWREASSASQDIMSFYAGEYRYESVLQMGLARLRQIRKIASDTLLARNLHELMRCLEALNLIDVSEAIILSTLERKESRVTKWETFTRIDFPKENPEMNRLLILKLENGQPEFSWREPRTFITGNVI